MHAVFYHIFPINLSSTTFRLIFRIPSLYYLFKSFLLLLVTLLQVSGLYPSWNLSLFNNVSSWADSKEMTDICWTTFCSVCLTLSIAALTRGLEGHEQSNSPPFNLVGVVFFMSEARIAYALIVWLCFLIAHILCANIACPPRPSLTPRYARADNYHLTSTSGMSFIITSTVRSANSNSQLDNPVVYDPYS